jgi:type II secretory pathway pseudopilin PulG
MSQVFNKAFADNRRSPQGDLSQAGFTPLEKNHSGLACEKVLFLKGGYGIKALFLKNAGGRRSLTGFTFIETLFVVIVIGILLGFAFPFLQKNIRGFEFESFSRKMQASMNYFSQRSIMEREIILLTIDQERRLFWAQGIISSIVLKNVTIPKGIEVQSDKKSIYFYPDGSIDKVNIMISNAEHQSLNLTTQGVYGHVKVQAP